MRSSGGVSALIWISEASRSTAVRSRSSMCTWPLDMGRSLPSDLSRRRRQQFLGLPPCGGPSGELGGVRRLGKRHLEADDAVAIQLQQVVVERLHAQVG